MEADRSYSAFYLWDPELTVVIGYLNGGKFKYADASGYNLDNQALVFNVKLPKGARPS